MLYGMRAGTKSYCNTCGRELTDPQRLFCPGCDAEVYKSDTEQRKIISRAVIIAITLFALTIVVLAFLTPS
jgi:uncharacterized OB-fold protein